ncbi:MAG TPA: ParB/Srx family N-terminal domain-containing protein, partial [Fimbriimonadaceae bacterium]|nr:ParB/Srx family N-terminal domain-containing protein [Fimbriimonadaceae bacterium]
MSEKNPYILAAESVGSKPKATSNPYEEEAKFRASFEGAKAETARLALKGKANPNLIPAALRQKQLPTIADALPASSARSALELAARVSPEARRAITVHPKDPWADFGFTREDLQRSIDLNLPHVRLKGSDQYISLDAAQRQVQKRFGKPVRFEGSKPPEQVEQEFYERGNENIETPSERGRRRFLEKKKEGSNQLHNIINEHPIFLLAKGVKALATDVPNAYIAAAMSVPGSRLPATSKLTEAELASAVHERAKTSPGAVMFQYLMPGIGQAHLLGDVTGTVGSAIEKESTKPIQDFGKQMVQGTAFWEPGIGFEERIVRMLNAAMLGHGFAKAVQHPLAYKARQAAAGRIAEGIERFWSKAKEGGANEAIAEGSKSLKIAPELLKKSIEAESQPPRKADSVPAPQSPKPEPIVTKPRQTQFSSEGHTFEESRIPPQEIGVMPGLQYKKVGVVDPANAVTDELKGVKKYDQATAGPLTVWETMDGKRWVMNGHHRRELAIRTGEADVPVRVFRESDGIDFKTARALGALQNMRDGKGTAIDAATVLRDLGAPMEKLKEYGLNTRSGVARDAISLLQLDPDSLRLVEEGSVPESVAAGIADAGLDPKRQAAVMRLAAASDLETRNQGAFLGERAKSAPMVDRTGGSGDLFGEIEESLALVEQAKIADAAMKRLAQSQRALSAFNRAKSVGKTFIDS